MAVVTIAGMLKAAVRGSAGGYISGAMRRTIIQKVIGANLGVLKSAGSANRLLGRVRSAGLGIRRTDFLNIFRVTTTRGVMAGRQLTRALDRPPPFADIPVGPVGMRREYLYHFTVQVKLEYGQGSWGRQHLQYSSHDRLSPLEVRSRFENQFGSKFDPGIIRWGSFGNVWAERTSERL